MLFFTWYFNVKREKHVINLSLISEMFKKTEKSHPSFHHQ